MKEEFGKMSTSFGGALSEFMTLNNLTQQEVAERCGVAQPVVGGLLKAAQPELPTIRKIAEGLDVEFKVNHGDIYIDPLNQPANIEIEASCEHTSYPNCETYRVYCSMFDKIQTQQIFEATLIYRLGESAPEEVTYKRQNSNSGLVSNAGLLRWAEAYAKKVLPWPVQENIASA